MLYNCRVSGFSTFSIILNACTCGGLTAGREGADANLLFMTIVDRNLNEKKLLPSLPYSNKHYISIHIWTLDTSNPNQQQLGTCRSIVVHTASEK